MMTPLFAPLSLEGPPPAPLMVPEMDDPLMTPPFRPLSLDGPPNAPLQTRVCSERPVDIFTTPPRMLTQLFLDEPPAIQREPIRRIPPAPYIGPLSSAGLQRPLSLFLDQTAPIRRTPPPAPYIGPLPVTGIRRPPPLNIDGGFNIGTNSTY